MHSPENRQPISEQENVSQRPKSLLRPALLEYQRRMSREKIATLLEDIQGGEELATHFDTLRANGYSEKLIITLHAGLEAGNIGTIEREGDQLRIRPKEGNFDATLATQGSPLLTVYTSNNSTHTVSGDEGVFRHVGAWFDTKRVAA